MFTERILYRERALRARLPERIKAHKGLCVGGKLDR